MRCCSQCLVFGSKGRGSFRSSSNVMSTSQQCSTLCLFDYRLVDQVIMSADLIKVTELTQGGRESRTSAVFTVIPEGWGFTFWLCGVAITGGAGSPAGQRESRNSGYGGFDLNLKIINCSQFYGCSFLLKWNLLGYSHKMFQSCGFGKYRLFLFGIIKSGFSNPCLYFSFPSHLDSLFKKSFVLGFLRKGLVVLKLINQTGIELRSTCLCRVSWH